MHDGSVFRQALSTEVLPGVPGYAVVEKIGAGGYSNVFKAVHERTGQQVALKVMRALDAAPQDLQRQHERFEREMALVSGLQHPYIVRLLDKGWTNGGDPYAVFELVGGETLGQYMARLGPLPAPLAGELMLQVLDALVCAHREGVVHRDLKPSNIMVSVAGAAAQIKILDFGVSGLALGFRAAGHVSLTHTGESIGTPSYCAPEQIRGEPPTPQCDLYAWGLIFLECLTGHPAIPSDNLADVLHLQLSQQEVPLPPGLIGHPLATLLRRVLKKKPQERCRDAAELWSDLRATPLHDLVGVLAPQDAPVGQASDQTPLASSYFQHRRQISTLCCHLSARPLGGPDTVDIEALEIVQIDLVNQLKDVATRYGGWVADTFVEQVLVYFGYPYAADGDAVRAARTAMDMVALVAERVRALGGGGRIAVHVRIGMDTGMVVHALNEVPIGLTVRRACNLAQLAEPGRVLVGAASVQCLQRHARFTDNPLADLVQAQWGIATAYLAELNAPDLSSQGDTPMVGRQAQAAALREAVGAAAAGQGRVVALIGEAGIGKSRMVEELTRMGGGPLADVLVFFCAQEYRNRALYPVLQWFRQQLASPGHEEGEATALRQHLETLGGDITQLLPIFCDWLYLPLPAGGASTLAPQVQKQCLLEALVRSLRARGGGRPGVVVFEDLHWADPTSLEFIEVLRASPWGQALTLVLTARPGVQHAVLKEATCITLGRLDQAATLEVASHCIGGAPMSPDVADLVFQRTEGIPLFIQEIISMMKERHLVCEHGTWRMKRGSRAQDVPLTLRDLLIGRLDRLGTAKEVAQLAAVLGRTFERELMLVASGLPPETLDGHLDTLVRQEILQAREHQGRPGYAFRHALIQDATRETLSQASAIGIHRQVAQALVSHFAHRVLENPGDLARHHAGAQDFDEAVRRGIDAVSLAVSHSLHKEALAHAHEVLQWNANRPGGPSSWRDELRLNDLIIPVLMVVEGYGDRSIEAVSDRSIELDRQLRRDGAHEGMDHHTQWALTQYQHMRSNRGAARQQAAYLVSAARDSGNVSDLVDSLPLLGLCLATDGDPEAGCLLYEEAVALYDPARDRHAMARNGIDPKVHALTNKAMAETVCDRIDAARASLAQAMDWALTIGHAPSIAICHVYVAQCAYLAGERDLDEVRRQQDAFFEATPDLQFLKQYPQAIFDHGQGLTAHQLAFSSFRLASQQSYLHSLYEAVLASTLIEQGAYEQAQARLTHAMAWCDEHGEQAFVAHLAWLEGKLLRLVQAPEARWKDKVRWAASTALRQRASLFERRARELMEGGERVRLAVV